VGLEKEQSTANAKTAGAAKDTGINRMAMVGDTSDLSENWRNQRQHRPQTRF